ncbi:MAG: hypothetical protein B6I35_15305 [Anaerolineaceae bacterium 4572_32.2]|nr:MAG: hypothetical protein B6I35_15305 [Anaerolineaceae bacterium 4572_32.2]
MSKFQHTERGQALVIMVFGFVVLLAVLGLAIDGGAVLLDRRRMQNAADAASLAGARKLAEAICDAEGVDDAAIVAQVNLYAMRNGVVDPQNNVVADYVEFDGETPVALGRVGSGSIPTGATAISTSVEISRSTYFIALLGINTTNIPASALGVTSPPLVAGGLRPFGVPLQVIQALDPSDPANNWFTISFKHDGGDITWAGSNIAQHRGWMNVGYVWNQRENPDFPRAIDESANAAILKEWMENGWQGVLYADCLWDDDCRTGDYIHSKPGTNSSAVCAAPENTLIYIPIYDQLPSCATEVPDPKPDCPTQGSGDVYHIVGFGGVKITDCKQGQGEITAEVVKTIMGEGVPSFGLGTGYGEARACEMYTQIVTLWQ